ncbi:MAG TPA: PAS domain S-box protein, partial [Salinarimonas sp.]|nr:PAS domain S-box protein [Salinarimonas sp.]
RLHKVSGFALIDTLTQAAGSTTVAAARGIRSGEFASFIRVAELNLVGMFAYNTNTHEIVYANERLAEILGYTKADLNKAGAKWPAYHDHEDWHHVAELLAEQQHSRLPIRRPISFRHRAGHKVPTFLALLPPQENSAQGIGAVVDLTDITQAREALRIAEATFEGFLENMPLVAFVKTLDGRYQHVNQEFLRATRRKREEVVGRTDAELFGPDQAEAFALIDQELVESGESHAIPDPRFSADGTRIYMNTRFLLRDPAGAPRALCGLAMDVTREKETEMALRASEERLSAALSAAEVGTWFIDLRRGVEIRDAALNRLMGLPAVETTNPIGAAEQHLHPDDVQVFRTAAEATLRDGAVFDAEYRVIRPGGMVRWFRGRGRSVFDAQGKPLLLAGAAIDLTERKATELALRLSNERYQILSRATNDVVWDWDVSHDVMWWNQGLESVFGYQDAEGRSASAWWLDRIHPQDRERVACNLQVVMQKTLPQWREQYRFLRANGTYAYVLERGSASYTPEGQPLRLMGAMADITELKEKERALQESEERFREISDIGIMGIAFFNRDGVITDANRRFLEIIDYDRNDLRHREIQWRRLVPPDQWSRMEEMFIELEASRRLDAREHLLMRHDGTRFWGLIGCAVLQSGQRAAFVLDISAQKAAELRQRFLIQLADETRGLEDQEEVLITAETEVGRHFKVSRVVFGEIDEAGEHVQVQHDWCNGVASVAGRHRLEDFGPELVAELRAGHTITVEDTRFDSRTREVAQAAFDAIETRALLCVPLVKNGRFAALLALNHRLPR